MSRVDPGRRQTLDRESGAVPIGLKVPPAAAYSACGSREKFAMSTLYRYALPVEQTKWKFDGKTETCFTWEYDDSRVALLQL